MKSIAVFLLVVGILAYLEVARGADTEAQKKAKETCAKTNNLTADEIKITKESKQVSKTANASQNLKCYLLCFYKEAGVIGSGGKPDPEAIVKYLEEATGVKDKMKLSAAMMSCSEMKGANECENIFMFENCVFKELVA